MRIAVLCLSGALLAVVASNPPVALAQDAGADPTPAASEPAPPPRKGIEEIVIRAGESDAASDFEAGDSVAAFDASDLEALGAQSIADLAAFTPNLEIVTSGATTPTFFIRGVGLNDFNANSSGAVAIYQDDVPKNAPALQLGTLFDVESVNILRGPQGTGPFRNATAGAIKIYSRKPTGEFGAFLTSNYGNFNYMDFEGAVEMPVYEDILSARFAFRWSEREGYAKNRCGDAPAQADRVVNESICGESVVPAGTITLNPNPPPFILFADGLSLLPEGLPSRVNNRDNWAARGVLRFEPTLDMEWLLTAHGARRNEQSRLGQSVGTFATAFDQDCLEELGPNVFLPGQTQPCLVPGVLGGVDQGNFQSPEVASMLAAANPCLDADGVAIPGACQDFPAQRLWADNKAKLQVANKLARQLDFEPHVGEYDRVGPTTNDQWGVSLKGDMVLGDSIYFTTVSAYDTYDRVFDVDLDFSPNELFEIFTDDDGWQFTQDIQFSGDISEEIPLNWTLGAFYLMEELNVEIENTFLPLVSFGGILERAYTQKLYSLAGYAEFEWDFWDDFTLDGGVRYNWEHKTIDYVIGRGTGQAGDNATFLAEDDIWQAPTGTIRLTYRFREDTHAYWKYTRGWKGGHYNATSSDFSGITIAEPETIDAFEAGLRGSWFEGRLGANFSIFHYDYENYQIFTAQQQLGSQPEFVILNAKGAEVLGSELDLTARPYSGLYLQARLAWLQTQFLDFVQIQTAQRSFGGSGIPVDIEVQNTGNPLLNSPKYKVSLTAEQTIPLGRFGSVIARWDGAWTDDVTYDATDSLGTPNFDNVQFLPENTIGQQAYWVHNARLSYRTPDGTIEVAGWVRNFMDEVYKTFAFDGSTFNKTTIYFVGEPRTYGVSLTGNF